MRKQSSGIPSPLLLAASLFCFVAYPFIVHFSPSVPDFVQGLLAGVGMGGCLLWLFKFGKHKRAGAS